MFLAPDCSAFFSLCFSVRARGFGTLQGETFSMIYPEWKAAVKVAEMAGAMKRPACNVGELGISKGGRTGLRQAARLE